MAPKGLNLRTNAALQKWLRIFFVGSLLLLSVAYLAQMAIALYTFGFTQPAFDQYMTYPHYLNKAFPQNILSNENGHRPIFPALVRVIEISWSQSDQHLQRAVGFTLMLLSWTGLLWLSIGTSANRSDTRTGQRVGTIQKALIVLACTLALFWAGNIRMQVHANEQLHVYGVILGLVVALGALWEMHRKSNWSSFLLLCAGATFGTFCFGNGLVIFPTVLCLAVLLRLHPRWLLGILLASIAIALLYTRFLPESGVPSSIKLRDVPTGLVLLASWLNSAWVSAWLKFASAPVAQIDYIGSIAMNTAWVGHSAHALAQLSGLSAPQVEIYVTRGLGALSVTASLIVMVRHFWVPVESRLQLTGLGLMLFSLGTGGLIVLFRVQYLIDEPGQLFADRYVFWSCVWWLGIVIYATSFLRRPSLQFAAAALGIAVAWSLALSNAYGLGWARIVHDDLNRQAIGFRLGLVDHTYSASVSTMPIAQTLAVIDLLKQRRLAQFSPRLLEPSDVPAQAGSTESKSGWSIVNVEKTQRFHERPDVWYFTGRLAEADVKLSPYEFIVLNEKRERCGGAIQTFDNTPPTRSTLGRKLGFAGYYTCRETPERATLYARDHAGVWTSIGPLKQTLHIK